MKIYLAGIMDNSLTYRTNYNAKRILISFAKLGTYQKIQKVMNWCNNAAYDKIEIFLDSGAFTAFSVGQKIDLWSYIDFIQKYGKRFSVIAAHDDIKNPDKTMNNFKDMQRVGIDCIPTFHAGEPYEYLEKYCKLSDYVAIGGLVRGVSDQKILGFNKLIRIEILNKILEKVPKDVRLHLFGFSDLFLLKKYADRIYSVDTTRWLASAKYATCFTRSGKSIPYVGRQPKHNAKSLIGRVAYSIRRFSEWEEDINNSLQKDLLKVVT